MKKQQEDNKEQIDILTKHLNSFEEKIDTFNTTNITGILQRLESSAPFVTNNFYGAHTPYGIGIQQQLYNAGQKTHRITF